MDGVIYVATGADYVDLAVQSARSLNKSNPEIAADLFCGPDDQVPAGVFQKVHAVPRVHARAKLDCLPLSRFDRTLFLDADTLVVGDLGDLWQVADRFDLALAHDVRRRSELIREGLEVETPYAFPQLNSGVMLYRKSPEALAFFEEWSRRFGETGVARDQIILKDLLWRGRLCFYVLPPEFNLRRVTVLVAWEPLDAEVKIIHSHRFKDHLQAGKRIGDLATLMEAERDALVREWREHGAESKLAWFTGEKPAR